jgi:hypothetical protein
VQNNEANTFARFQRGTESQRIGAAAGSAALIAGGLDTRLIKGRANAVASRSTPRSTGARAGRLRPLQFFAAMLALGVSPLAAQSPSQAPTQQEPTFRRGSGGMPPWAGWGNENDLGGSLVRTEGSGVIDEDVVRTAREVASHSVDPKTGQVIGTPTWENPVGFEKDVFTFARAIFKVGPNTAPGYGRGRRLGWWVDFPDADLNLSYRLQQMTSMRTDPDGRVLKLNNPDLHNYPCLLMEHPGYMMLRDSEVAGLRKYLLAGGVLAIIDFWNTREWDGFAAQMKRVLPERNWTELTMDHPIFHCVFELRARCSGCRYRRCSSGIGATTSTIRIRRRCNGIAAKVRTRCRFGRSMTTKGT